MADTPAAPAVSHVVVMERERRISKFYGDDPAMAPEFEEEIRRAWAAMPSSSAAHRLDVLLGNVGPTVRAELRCQPAEVQEDPERALAAILEVFGERRTPAQLLQNLLTLRQLPPESVRAFSHRCQSAYLMLVKRQESIGEAPYPDRLLRDHFLSNLRDVTLSRFLRDSLHQSPELTFRQIRESAIRWADDGAEQQPVHVAPITASATPGPTSQTREDRLELALTTILEKMDRLLDQRGPQRRREERLCYSCRKPGHFKRDCPDRHPKN
ncbi:hypothetical protein EGW08_017270 [Elysia chlorotica]|uniref:CCHC-type domain-containing protein n=1 Tax=Elysia chlorotica TaxID=188477 RepID=A0A3S1AXQ0_ELYCH|nr:hypothetical protein EGW08_017270 [Elysia chlorotica]